MLQARRNVNYSLKLNDFGVPDFFSVSSELVLTNRSFQQQIESFINKLLEQPFCHYQTENNIRSLASRSSITTSHEQIYS